MTIASPSTPSGTHGAPSRPRAAREFAGLVVRHGRRRRAAVRHPAGRRRRTGRQAFRPRAAESDPGGRQRARARGAGRGCTDPARRTDVDRRIPGDPGRTGRIPGFPRGTGGSAHRYPRVGGRPGPQLPAGDGTARLRFGAAPGRSHVRRRHHRRGADRAEPAGTHQIPVTHHHVGVEALLQGDVDAIYVKGARAQEVAREHGLQAPSTSTPPHRSGCASTTAPRGDHGAHRPARPGPSWSPRSSRRRCGPPTGPPATSTRSATSWPGRRTRGRPASRPRTATRSTATCTRRSTPTGSSCSTSRSSSSTRTASWPPTSISHRGRHPSRWPRPVSCSHPNGR